MKRLRLFALAMLGSLFKAFVASMGWSWFAVPLGLPSIGTWQMMGLFFLLDLLRSKSISEESLDETADDLEGMIAAWLTGPATTLAIMYAIHVVMS